MPRSPAQPSRCSSRAPDRTSGSEQDLHPGSSSRSCRSLPLPMQECRSRGITPRSLLQPVPLGIAAGLLLGKLTGVFLASFVAGDPAGAGEPANGDDVGLPARRVGALRHRLHDESFHRQRGVRGHGGGLRRADPPRHPRRVDRFRGSPATSCSGSPYGASARADASHSTSWVVKDSAKRLRSALGSRKGSQPSAGWRNSMRLPPENSCRVVR